MHRTRIFVLGASSPLGMSLDRQLADCGHDVHLRSRTRPPVPHCLDGRWRPFDLGDPHSLPGLGLRDGDCLVSAAPLEAFARACTGAVLPFVRLVAVSSASASTKRASRFPVDAAWSAAMRDAEGIVARTFGSAAVILRPTMVYGSGRDRNIARLAAFLRRYRVLPLVGGGHGLRAPVHVDDLAAVIVRLLAAPWVAGPILHVPGGEVLSYRQMAVRTAEACRVRFMAVPLPPVPVAAVRAIERCSPAAARVLAALARTAEDLVVPDDAAVVGVDRRPFRPDRRAVGLSEAVPS